MLFVILRYSVLFCLFALVCMSKRLSGPAPRKGVPGRCPPNHCLCPLKRELCPPSEDCAPKKVTSLMPLGAVRGLRPSKYWSSPQNSWVRTVYSQICGETFLFSPYYPWNFAHALQWKFLFFGHHSRESFCAQPNLFMPPSSHASLAPGLAILMILFCKIMLIMRYYW